MIDALYNGISGLNVNQNALDTQTNNISNVNTVGYKSDKISFADMMYQNSIGKGAAVATVDKDFSQGNLKSTNNPFDLAIQGKGYFIVKGTTNELNYTRAGNFKMASDGTLQMPNGYTVQGLNSTEKDIKGTSQTDVKFTDEFNIFVGSKVIKNNDSTVVKTINSKSTNYNNSAKDDLISESGNNYKTRESKIIDAEEILSKYKLELNSFSLNDTSSIAPTFQESTISFNKSLLVDENSSLSIQIGGVNIDEKFSKNSEETLNNFANNISSIKGITANIDTNGNLTIKSLIPGETVLISNANNNQNSKVVQQQLINTTESIRGEGQARLDAFENQVQTLLERADAKYLRITNTVDSINPQTKTLENIQLDLQKLNLSDNSFGEIDVDNGIVYVKQNDTRFVIGKIMISSFISQEGLIPIGDNMYSASLKSGEAIYSNDISKINNKMLELSNSDLATGLVDLMIYQRAFEANSKSITTSDDFLKTAIQLKK